MLKFSGSQHVNKYLENTNEINCINPKVKIEGFFHVVNIIHHFLDLSTLNIRIKFENKISTDYGEVVYKNKTDSYIVTIYLPTIYSFKKNHFNRSLLTTVIHELYHVHESNKYNKISEISTNAFEKKALSVFNSLWKLYILDNDILK